VKRRPILGLWILLTGGIGLIAGIVVEVLTWTTAECEGETCNSAGYWSWDALLLMGAAFVTLIVGMVIVVRARHRSVKPGWYRTTSEPSSPVCYWDGGRWRPEVTLESEALNAASTARGRAVPETDA
jgi:hypothetical protein